jgi:hypothetical protein
MRIINSKDFTAKKAWGAVDITKMNGVDSSALDRQTL